MRMTAVFGRRQRAGQDSGEAASHRLLLRAGYVRRHAAGIYSFLHPGLKSLRKIEAVVRQEMDHSGAQEILMPVVHAADVWRRTGRYDEIDNALVRFVDRRGRDMVLAMTHEEIVAELASSEIRSYRDAGVVVYQIQTKFRDEPRPRGGLLRTREFVMKDAYSLHLDSEGLAEAYATQAEAYKRIYRRLGLRNVHEIRSDTGVMGGSVAHEYTCLLDVGEDAVAFCRTCGDAWNADMTSSERCAKCGDAVELRRGVEVGNIFQLGTRYAEALAARAADRTGVVRPLMMGSYGIGISRLLAALVEQHCDERGIALPAVVASFAAHVVVLGGRDVRSSGAATDVYDRLVRAGVDTIWDDRDVGAGEQLADADLMGAAIRVTVGSSSLDADVVELRERRTGRKHIVGRSEVAGSVRAILDELERSNG